MRRAFLTLLLPMLLPCPSRADERVPCGTVDALEITSLTRTKLTAFLRTSLPKAAAGGRQNFAGQGGAKAPVCGAGVLKIGTPEVRSSAPTGAALAGFSGARFTGMTLTEVQGTATATFFNPLSFPLDVKDLVYAVWVGDRQIAEGERHGLRLHPGRENAVELPINASSADLLSALGSAVAGGSRVAGRLIARVSVRVGRDQILMVPLDLPGSVEVLR